ncbi:hypothetical protein C5D18_06730 [Rathayibacter tritici]|nr:hypothetical protein C5D18_06730 [Rathayibacter tritici]
MRTLRVVTPSRSASSCAVTQPSARERYSSSRSRLSGIRLQAYGSGRGQHVPRPARGLAGRGRRIVRSASQSSRRRAREPPRRGRSGRLSAPAEDFLLERAVPLSGCLDGSRPGREEANEVRRILIVCGAGASSTFLAHRLRAGAKERGMGAEFRSETLTGLEHSLPEADVLLVGPHLESQFDGLRQRAELMGAAAALLPPDVFGAHGADAVLETLPVLFAARAVVAGADTDSSTRPVRPGEPDSGHH